MQIGAHATQHDGVGAGLDVRTPAPRRRRLAHRMPGRAGDRNIGRSDRRQAERYAPAGNPTGPAAGSARRACSRAPRRRAACVCRASRPEVPCPDAYLGKALEDASGAGKLLERQPVRGDRIEPGRARHDLHGERAGALPLRRRGRLDVDAMNRHFEHDVLNELGRIHSGPPMAAGPLCNTEVFSTGKMPPINLSHSSPRRERRHFGVKAAAGPATGRPCRRVRHAGGGPPPRHLPICAPAAPPRRRGSGTARPCSGRPWR